MLCLSHRLSPMRLFKWTTPVVKAAILLFQNNETVAILVYQTSPVGVELFSYAKALFVPRNLHRCLNRRKPFPAILWCFMFDNSKKKKHFSGALFKKNNKVSFSFVVAKLPRLVWHHQHWKNSSPVEPKEKKRTIITCIILFFLTKYPYL